jgi:hypothetical protein
MAWSCERNKKLDSCDPGHVPPRLLGQSIVIVLRSISTTVRSEAGVGPVFVA